MGKKMTIRKALIFYGVSLLVALLVAWALAYFVAWWDGMVLMTVIVLDHARHEFKIIRRGG